MYKESRGHRHAGGEFARHEVRHYGATATAIAIAAVMAASAIATTTITLTAQAKEADRQKQASELEADQAAKMAEAESSAQREKNKRLMASQDAAAGASGVEIGSGSLLIDAVESAQFGEYDAQLAGFPHSLQSERARFASKLFSDRASSIRSTMGIQAGLAGASSAASSYGAYSRGSLGGGYVNPSYSSNWR